MATHRESEVTLWRFGLALMGGRTMLWMAAGAYAFGLAYTVYVAMQPGLRADRNSLTLAMAAFCANGVFLMMPLAAAQLWVQQRRHPILHLTPGGDARLRALLWRIAWLAAAGFVPALVLRVFASAVDRSDPSLAMIPLASVEAYVWRGWALYLLGIAGITLFAACRLRTPLALLAAPVQIVSFQASLRHWWVPATAFLLLIGLPWLYRRLTAAEPPRQLRMLDENVYLVTDSPSAASNRYMYRISQSLARWNAFRLRRVVDGRNGPRATALANLGANSLWTTSWLATLSLAAAVAVVQPVSPTWWGGAFNLFFGPIAALVAMPGPVMLTSAWLLPVGLDRARVGETLVTVWMRRLRARITMGVALGALVILAIHLVDPAWPQWRTQTYGARSLSEKLLFAPLGLAFALHGVAYTSCALLALSPRLLARGAAQWLQPASFLLIPVVVGGGMGLADELVLRYGLKAYSSTAPFVVFLTLFGVILPAIAWLLLRTRRGAWRRADLAAISARMAEWSRSVQARLAQDRDVVVNVSSPRTRA
jgi:hypothetical protein